MSILNIPTPEDWDRASKAVSPEDCKRDDNLDAFSGPIGTLVPRGVPTRSHLEGKPEMRRIMQMRHALEGAARIMMYGDDKHGEGSWATRSVEEILDGLIRHTGKVAAGEEIDEDSLLYHWDHMACRCLIAAEIIRRKANAK